MFSIEPSNRRRVLKNRVSTFRRAALALLLLGSVFNTGCNAPSGQNNVTWEFVGDDVRVIEKAVHSDGDRRNYFTAATLEKVTASGHVVKVVDDGETFKVYCLDDAQASDLAAVLEEAMNKKLSD